MKEDYFSNMIKEFPFPLSIIIESSLNIKVYLYVLLRVPTAVVTGSFSCCKINPVILSIFNVNIL